MLLATVVSFKLPPYLTKLKKRQEGVKEKKYAVDKNANVAENSMNIMLFVMLAMSTWFGWVWPVGMSLYWGMSAFSRILQSLYIFKYHSLKK